MDWSYVIFAIKQGGPGLALLLLPVPILSYAAVSQRGVAAALPGLVAAALFLAFAILAGATSYESPKILGYLPVVGLLLTATLLPSSVLALRNKWAGLLHLLTAAGALFTAFVSAMAISHDWL